MSGAGLFLPGTGKGTMRSMVEGARPSRIAMAPSPSTTGCAGGPPPLAGEE